MSFDQTESDFSSCSNCDTQTNTNSDSCSDNDNTTSSCCDTVSSSCDASSKSCSDSDSCSRNRGCDSFETCSSFYSDGCASDTTSCCESLTESCFSDLTDVSCGTSSDCSNTCSTTKSCDSCSCSASVKWDKRKSKAVIDLATAKLSVLPTKKVYTDGDFVGTRVLAHGYIYEGCTICCCDSELFQNCGVVCDKPEDPCDVIGTYDLEYVIVNPEFNDALKYLFTGDLEKYLRESKRLAGRVLADASVVLSLSDSDDFYLPSEDTIQLKGRIPWGIKGQEWVMAVVGGTGDYKDASGQGKVERLTVANGSCTRLGESWRMSFDLDNLLKRKC